MRYMLHTLAEYLFNTKPLSFSHLGVFVVGSAVGALVAGAVISLSLEKAPLLYRKLLKKVRRSLIWYGIITAFFYFIRTERIPYLSMRLWLWGWIIGFVGFLTFSLYREYRRIPIRREKLLKEEKLKRYLGT